MLHSPDIDAVAVVTPVWTHFELAKAALENGKHVFVEKPFTSTSAQAEELIELAERKNLQIMVDHTFLFSGAVRKIRELVDNGTLGPLYYFDSTRVNLGLFQHDVSVVWDLAPHDLSIMDHIIGEQPEAVVATGGKHLNGLADMAFITIYFPGNVIAHVNVNWLSPVKVRTTLIGGKDKMLVWNDLEADEKIKVYDKGVQITNGEGVYDLLVSYRSGDVWAPKVRPDRGAEGRARLLRRLHRERPDAHQRRRGRPAGRPAARSGRSVAQGARKDRPPSGLLPRSQMWTGPPADGCLVPLSATAGPAFRSDHIFSPRPLAKLDRASLVMTNAPVRTRSQADETMLAPQHLPAQTRLPAGTRPIACRAAIHPMVQALIDYLRCPDDLPRSRHWTAPLLTKGSLGLATRSVLVGCMVASRLDTSPTGCPKFPRGRATGRPGAPAVQPLGSGDQPAPGMLPSDHAPGARAVDCMGCHATRLLPSAPTPHGRREEAPERFG